MCIWKRDVKSVTRIRIKFSVMASDFSIANEYVKVNSTFLKLRKPPHCNPPCGMWGKELVNDSQD